MKELTLEQMEDVNGGVLPMLVAWGPSHVLDYALISFGGYVNDFSPAFHSAGNTFFMKNIQRHNSTM